MNALRFLAGTLATAALLLPSVAVAHVRLTYPTPRYAIPAGDPPSSDDNLKFAPCGVEGGDSRTTDESRITTLEAGAPITVEFFEPINHTGHYRIAFDDDGQDFEDPASYDDIQEPGGMILLDGILDKSGGNYTANITLPNTPCNNCTLQLIQVMTDKAPYVLHTDDVYHQCADLVLTGPGGGAGGVGGASGAGGNGGASGGSGAAGTSSQGGTTGAGGTQVSGSGGVAGSGVGSGGLPQAGASPGGSTPVAPRTAAAEDSSCAVAPRQGAAHGALFELGVLALGLSLRRARSRRSRGPR